MGVTKPDDIQKGAKLEFLGTATADSNTTSLEVSWTDTAHQMYLVVGQELKVVSLYAGLRFRLGDTNGVDSGSSDYSSIASQNSAASSTTSEISRNESLSGIGLATRGMRSTAAYGLNFTAWVAKGDGTRNNQVTGTSSYTEHTGVLAGGHLVGMRKTAITVDRVAVVATSGNMPNGRLTVWGLRYE